MPFHLSEEPCWLFLFLEDLFVLVVEYYKDAYDVSRDIWHGSHLCNSCLYKDDDPYLGVDSLDSVSAVLFFEKVTVAAGWNVSSCVDLE